MVVGQFTSAAVQTPEQFTDNIVPPGQYAEHVLLVGRLRADWRGLVAASVRQEAGVLTPEVRNDGRTSARTCIAPRRLRPRTIASLTCLFKRVSFMVAG
jgi:hypothetical protein